ncbi:hypothetical protein DRH13_02985 [Candidatus Woesebacteria bacterium]|nr:MAG: hypothetical protein DRH13_02985 [Candidatus Woesebacteria bacterium]
MAESEFRPNINYKAEVGGGGPPDGEKREQEELTEQARLMGERAGIYPMEGSDIVELLTEVEIGKAGDTKELELVTKEALAYKEGLKFGFSREAYFDQGRGEQSSIIYLQNLFTSVEGATGRPKSPYIDPALEGAIGQRIRESGRYERNPGAWKLKQEKRYGKINRGRVMRGEEPLSDEGIGIFIEPQESQLKNSIEARSSLRRLENHIEARKIIDMAFLQRMGTCEDPEGATEISRRYGTAYSPDKGHWKAFFQDKEKEEAEWGKKVDKVFWRIVSFGLPDEVIKNIGLESIPTEIRTNDEKPGENVGRNIYFTGFEKTKQFKNWIKYLLDGADGDMDAVWAAWRVALLWEIPNELGLNIDAGKNKWNIPFPPIGSALHSFSAHVEAKRALEFGLKPDGSLDKSKADRFISHSGLPMSLGKFPSLCKSFLHESECRFSLNEILKRKDQMKKLIHNLPQGEGDPYYSNMHKADIKHYVSRYKDMKEKIEEVIKKSETEDGRKELSESTDMVNISLWEMGLFAKVSFDSEHFPWMAIEESLEGEEAGEVAPGGFGSWLLRRSRAWSIIKDIRSRPSLSDIASPDFFNDGSRVRTWSKVLGPLQTNPSHDLYVAPKDNPRTWWLAGLIWYHREGGSMTSKITKEDNYKDYRTFVRREVFKQKGAGHVEGDRGVLLGDILKHAKDSGFIRREDAKWILSELQLKTRAF